MFKMKIYPNDQLPPDNFMIVCGDEAVFFSCGEIHGPVKISECSLKGFEQYNLDQEMDK